MAYQPVALFDDRVDRTEGLRPGIQRVEVTPHSLLVRDRDVRSQIILAAQRVHRIAKGIRRRRRRVVPHVEAVVVQGGEVSQPHERQSVEAVMPGPQGRVVYTARGLFTEEAKPYPTKLFSEGICFIPAHHGHSFLGISGLSRGSKKSKARISVYLLGQDQPLLPLPEIPFVLGRGDLYNRSFSPDKRFHFSPRYDLLVVIPPTNDRLLLTVVDVIKVLQQSGRRYLFVTSIPPVQAVLGSTYKYQIEVQSREKELSYSLESGPNGLSVSPPGAVTWKVPKSAAPGQNTVIIKVRDASGQEIFHTFVINLK